MSTVIYPLGYRHLGRARVDLLAADLRLACAGSGYTPADTDEWFAAVPETTGAGYTAGGQSLAGRTFDYDSVVGRAVLHADPVTWDVAGFTVRYAVVYAATGDPGTSPLLARIDFGSALALDGDPFTVTFTDGVLRLGPTTA